jgi:uncharacterized protein YbjQ (UPF0145 family)
VSFTSDLTIDELLFVEEAGFEPLELVLGSSYFHIGWQPALWNQNMELGQITQMMMSARQTAMGRMLEQAVAFGADGVVGVHVDIHRHGHNAEFTLVGTAVRKKDGTGAAWRPYQRPFTCDLTGGDFWALVRGGFRPVSLAHGVCVYHVAHQGLLRWFSQVGQNCEQEQFTQALYDARELAMERMQYEAHQLGATGVVNARIIEGNHGWDSHVIEFLAIGTSVAPLDVPVAHDEPKLVAFAQG